MTGGEVAVGWSGNVPGQGSQIVIGSQSDISRGSLPSSSGGRTFYRSEGHYRKGKSYQYKGTPKTSAPPISREQQIINQQKEQTRTTPILYGGTWSDVISYPARIGEYGGRSIYRQTQGKTGMSWAGAFVKGLWETDVSGQEIYTKESQIKSRMDILAPELMTEYNAIQGDEKKSTSYNPFDISSVIRTNQLNKRIENYNLRVGEYEQLKSSLIINPNEFRAGQYGKIASESAVAALLGSGLAVSGIASGVSRGMVYVAGKPGSSLIGGGLIATSMGFKTYEITKSYQMQGLSMGEGIATGIIGSSVETGAFLMGATQGEISPVKIRKTPIYQDMQGNIKSVTTLSVENPFGRGVKILGGYGEGYENIYHKTASERLFGVSAGFGSPKFSETGYQEVAWKSWDIIPKGQENVRFYGKSVLQQDIKEVGYAPTSKTEAAIYNKLFARTQLGVERGVQEDFLKTYGEVSDVKINTVKEFDFSKGAAYNKLTTEQQNVFTKELERFAYESGGKGQGAGQYLKGLWNTMTNKGLEEIYGSASAQPEGGFKGNPFRPNEQYADVDIKFRDLAVPKAERVYAALKGAGADVRLTEGLIEVRGPSGEYVHLLDVHGTDLPELMLKGTPYGLSEQAPKQGYINEQLTPKSTLSTESLRKIGAATQLRQNIEGDIYVSPPEHRAKDVTDAFYYLKNLNEIKGSPIAEKTLTRLGYGIKVTYGIDVNNPEFMPRQIPVYSSIATSSAVIPFINPRISPTQMPKAIPSSISPSTPSPSLPSPSMNLADIPKTSYLISPRPSRASASVSKIPSVSPSVSPYPSKSFMPSPSPSVSPSALFYQYASPSIYPSVSISSLSIITKSTFTMTPIPQWPQGYGEGFGKSQLRRQPFKYQPSFTASVLGIKSRRQPKTLTGLEFRPIVTGFRRRR